MKLHQEESEALENLARREWNEQNVKECIEAFICDRNFVGDNVIAIGQKRSSSLNKTMLQAIETAITETKKQKPGKETPLRLILVNITGGWNWLTGKAIHPNTVVHKALETWRTIRKRLALSVAGSQLEKLKKRIRIDITSEQWKTHFELLTNKWKQKRTEKQGRNYGRRECSK